MRFFFVLFKSAATLDSPIRVRVWVVFSWNAAHSWTLYFHYDCIVRRIDRWNIHAHIVNPSSDINAWMRRATDGRVVNEGNQSRNKFVSQFDVLFNLFGRICLCRTTDWVRLCLSRALPSPSPTNSSVYLFPDSVSSLSSPVFPLFTEACTAHSVSRLLLHCDSFLCCRCLPLRRGVGRSKSWWILSWQNRQTHPSTVRLNGNAMWREEKRNEAAELRLMNENSPLCAHWWRRSGDNRAHIRSIPMEIPNWAAKWNATKAKICINLFECWIVFEQTVPWPNKVITFVKCSVTHIHWALTVSRTIARTGSSSDGDEN